MHICSYFFSRFQLDLGKKLVSGLLNYWIIFLLPCNIIVGAYFYSEKFFPLLCPPMSERVNFEVKSEGGKGEERARPECG